MAIEKVLVPLRAIDGVGELCVETHNRREQLGEGEDEEASEEGRVDFGTRG